MVIQADISPRLYSGEDAVKPGNPYGYLAPACHLVYCLRDKQDGRDILSGIANMKDMKSQTDASLKIAGVTYDGHTNCVRMAQPYPGAATIGIVGSGCCTVACKNSMQFQVGQKLYADAGNKIQGFGSFTDFDWLDLTIKAGTNPLVGTFVGPCGRNAAQVLLHAGL